MKILYQIFIIGFVMLSLFIVKDDLKIAFDRIFSKHPIEISSDKSDTQGTTIVDRISSFVKSIQTPGALRVPDSSPSSNKPEGTLSIKGVIELTNKERSKNGNLSFLKENKKLDTSAEIKLKDMFAKQYFEHVSPSGVGVADIADQVGYEYIMIGENLALGGFEDNQALVDAWMASPGHRANILNKRYAEIGVAVGQGTFEGNRVWIAVQHFGLPEGACPLIDEKLQSVINLDEKNIKNMEADLTARKQRIDSGAVYNGFTTNEQIDQYNELVAQYNQLVTEIKLKISEYNQEVKVFNACLAGTNS